ncbi:TonB-dependent receptor [uncultured Pseudoteredinibacter sp.]|uniref:TonB-dependent receptor n=1 Tax=uncultured Pseudoteredinibacter sp. TaxID=1641701 RepID=UPI0026272653|nr:TonB-dependent receptor [uncultured Pseudoteredinibacter sp.]
MRISNLLLAALPLAISGQLQAQQTLEEVVVTAQKRAQSVQDIGVTVSAFNGEQVKDMNLNSPKDLASFTPGLSTANATSGGTPIFAIRGIGLDDFNINNNSGVGVYTDEVFASSPALLSGQLFDIERVEVLKGPQGTLYGKNTTGGAINFISNKPTEEFEASIRLGYGNWRTSSAGGFVSGSLSDDVRARVAFDYEKSDQGWQQDIDTGREFGLVDRFAMRSLFAFDMSERLSGLLNIHYSKDDSTPESPQSTGGPFAPSGFDIATGSEAADKVRVGDLNVMRDEQGVGTSLNLQYEFDSMTLTSITAWDDYERKVVDNLDGDPFPTFDFFQDSEVSQYSQEFRLSSDAHDNFSWVAGISFSNDEISVRDISDSAVPFGVFPARSQAAADYVQETDSLGAFIHTETDLSDQLHLSVGLRYSRDERSFNGNTIDVDGNVIFTEVGAEIASLNDSRTETDVSYRVGLDYDLNDNTLLYINVATGYKTGVFYGSPALAAEVWGYTEPEEVFSYELGFKADLLDQTLRLNGAYFHYDYDNRQSLLLGATADNIFIVTLDNIPESEIDGAEIELEWLPLEGLDIRAGISYLDAEVTVAPTSLRGLTLFTPVTPGTTLAQAPQWSYNLAMAYRWQLSDDLYARAFTSFSRVEEQAAALADPSGIYGPINNSSARLSIGDSAENWEVSLWGKNLADSRDVIYSAANFYAGAQFYRQQPRSYGIEVSFNFH